MREAVKQWERRLHQNQVLGLVIIGLLLLGLLGTVFAVRQSQDIRQQASTEITGCPEDLKVCPDGSTLSRSIALSCEFPECPDTKPDPSTSPDCVRAGCNGELCVNSDMSGSLGFTTCVFRPEYACYQAADCVVQQDGNCGFGPTDTVQQCLDSFRSSPTPTPSQQPSPTPEPAESPSPTPVPSPSITPSSCVRAGCSGQLCVSSDLSDSLNGIITTCEYLPIYACYQDAACELQPDGSCGFTPTQELQQCLNEFASPTPSPSSSPVCGNDICEAGEGYEIDCPDCDPVTSICPAVACIVKEGSCPADCPNNEIPPSPSPSPSPDNLRSDLNNDGRVDILDYTIMAGEFLQDLVEYQANITGDGRVDMLDFAILNQEFTLFGTGG